MSYQALADVAVIMQTHAHHRYTTFAFLLINLHLAGRKEVVVVIFIPTRAFSPRPRFWSTIIAFARLSALFCFAVIPFSSGQASERAKEIPQDCETCSRSFGRAI